jgi:membrane dipeptidase
MNTESAAELHKRSIVIDAVCPLAGPGSKYLDWYRSGGVTALAPSIETDDVSKTLDELGMWHRLFRERDDLIWVRRAADIEEAKQKNRLGIYFHFQGADPIGANLDLVDLYKSLGVGIIQLTYNVKNRVGDGCEERTDAGLSRFGIKLIERLNKARVIVDCSHTGLRTSLDAVECSGAPVVLSHTNVASVHSSPRNAEMGLIDAIARSGGLVGVVGFPGMVSKSPRPSLSEFVAHIDAIVQRVGIDHVGLGIDYYTLQAGVASDADALRGYENAVRAGIWSTAYPPPPHYYPGGIETPKTLPNLTEKLLQSGYTDADVRKILGENWLRVMRAVWGS